MIEHKGLSERLDFYEIGAGDVEGGLIEKRRKLRITEENSLSKLM